MEKNMRKPNFFIVGTARGGTTTLYYTLKKHPNVFMSSPEKEPKFFAKKWVSDEFVSWSDYLNLFTGAKDEKIIGEASTIYLYSKDAAVNIKNAIKNPKILIQLRDPTERAISHYKRGIRTGRETLSFSEALIKEEERIQKDFLPSYYYFKRGLYYEQVKRFYDCFNEEQILVTKFEDFKKNPQEVLKRICDFLEIDHKYLPDKIKRLNSGNKPRFPWINKFLANDSLQKDVLKVFIPKRIRRLLVRKFRWEWNLSSDDQTVNISDLQKKELKKRFASDVKKLESFLDWDLSDWLL